MTDRELLRQEFEIDRQIQDCKQTIHEYESGQSKNETAYYEAQTILPHLQRRYRSIVNERCGWRADTELVQKVYQDLNKDSEWVMAEIIRLESEEARYKSILANYDKRVKEQQEKIRSLNSALGNHIGYQPSQDEIDAAQRELLDIHREAGIAQAGLPQIMMRLDEMRNKGKAAKPVAKQLSQAGGKKYATPAEELDAIAKQYTVECKLSYGEAVRAVLREDKFLAQAYFNMSRADDD